MSFTGACLQHCFEEAFNTTLLIDDLTWPMISLGITILQGTLISPMLR